MVSKFTFIREHIEAFDMEVNDELLCNDVLFIEGESGSEQLIRGSDGDSIKKYARRSQRMNRPLGKDASTTETLAVVALDEFHEPKLQVVVDIRALDELIPVVLDLQVTDTITFNLPEIYIINQDFIIESVESVSELSDILASYKVRAA